MEATNLIDLIPSLGFPIVCVIAMGFFIFHLFKTLTETNKENMAQVQERSKAREEKLYVEITESRKINGQFAEIIAKYETKLDDIRDDVKDIKQDITEIKAKTE